MTRNKTATELGRGDRFYFAGKSFSCRQRQKEPHHAIPRMAETRTLWRRRRRDRASGRRLFLGGWVTGGKAEMIADQRARADVVAALTAICADQAKRDPLLAERVALLKTTASYGRGDLIMKNGWATMPGTAEPNR